MQSILTRADYEDYLIRLYFGATPDPLAACIDRAYLDMNRTLHGISDLPGGGALRAAAGQALARSLNAVRATQVPVATQADFDRWHRATCEHLQQLYASHGYPSFAVGQGQKWINMALKYIYTFGSERLPGFERIYPFCHVPLDNILLDRLTAYGFPPLACPWSRLNDYDAYLAYQNRIRRHFVDIPLDVEFMLWLRRDVQVRAMGDAASETHEKLVAVACEFRPSRASQTRGKAIAFAWTYDVNSSRLRIENENALTHEYSLQEIARILQRARHDFGAGFFPLANNVDRLSNGTERPGLGRLVLDQRPCDVSHAQGSSYLGVVLEECGFLEWNGKHRGIQWRLIEGSIDEPSVAVRLQQRGK